MDHGFCFAVVEDRSGDGYIWGFVANEPKQNAWKAIKEVPAKTPESDAMSKDLKRRGCKFVGSGGVGELLAAQESDRDED